MTISNESSYYEQVQQPFERCRISKTSLTVVQGRSYSSWLQAAGFPAVGVAPTTAAVPTSATAGCLKGGNGNTLNNGSGTRRILKTIFMPALTTAGGMITICDRLSHQGGLSGTATGAQTTNLPTAALTRYTSGVGVQCGLEIYTAIGATGTTVTTSYTNTTPTAGQVNPLATWGGTGFNAASRIVILPLVAGDVGVTAVASVTATASTLTVGNFGVTLFYPLVHVPIDDILAIKRSSEALYGFGTWFPEVKSNACLQFIYHMNGTATGIVQGEVLISEDR